MLDRKFVRWCLCLSLLAFFLCAASLNSFAQSDPSSEPALALRDALIAACSQNSSDFAHFLTARNVQAFSRLTPATRTTFLKRFVLLENPGQPRAEFDPSGNLNVFCATSGATTQMHIGKPELRDNLAYVSLAIGDAAVPLDPDSHRVLITLVREAGQWKLLSLGLLFLDLPSLGEEWDRAEITKNEQSAIDSIKQLSDAIETYRNTYTRLPEALAVLGPPSQGSAKSEKADLISREFADGRKDGYSFRYVVVGANTTGAPAKYELAAVPVDYGRTGKLSFFRDSSGVLHGADRRGAVGSVTDPTVN